MIEFPNSVRLVQTLSELPNYSGAKTMFLDLETSSGDPKKKSLNPWFDCTTAGIGITVDDDPWSYYVPIGHHDTRWNLPREAVIAWLRDIMSTPDLLWVNQNIKYDMRVAELDLGIRYTGDILDTLTLAKTYESDRLSYALERLSDDFLGHQIDYLKESLNPYLKDHNGKIVNNDYGRIPADIMAPYGGEDVLTVRRLWQFFTQTAYESRAFEIEAKVTPILYRMESVGMRTRPKMLDAMNCFHISRLIEVEQEIFAKTGTYVRPHVGDDCHELLCHQYGLPVLKLTNEDDADKISNPSFSKDALAQYLVYPGAPVELIRLLIDYRQMNTFRNFFLEPYTHLHVDGILHPSYTQAVRTGRMACRAPNAQQLNKKAKMLIIPPDGYGFISIDYSQIEFRLIAHYIQDLPTIEAYNANPDTDFHTWVAELCGINRKPAKNVNFCMGFGGGQNKLVSMLAKDETLVMAIKEEVDQLGLSADESVRLFESRAQQRAQEVYHEYHRSLPNLRPMSREAERRARQRGWVQNLVGRRRYLNDKRAHIAFNALNQSSAADIMKERLPHIEAVADSMGLQIVAIVHDEVLFQGPAEITQQDQTTRNLLEVMESPDVPLSLPVRCSFGRSTKSWADCGNEEKTWPLEDSPWLRCVRRRS